jgi:hypothetical protein
MRSLQFTRRRDFRKTLNERVDAYLRDNGLPARDVPAMYFKTAIALAWWLGTYLLLLLGNFPPLINVILCIMWAMSIASIGFNVMHDANHGGYSNHPRVNKLLSLSAEMLGMSGFRWRTKHNVWHHTYTNIAGFDDDVETYGLMRLTPRAPWKPLFKAQAWYFPIIYSLIGFDFILRDFMMVLIGKSDVNHVYPKMNAADKVTFWAGKLFFFRAFGGRRDIMAKLAPLGPVYQAGTLSGNPVAVTAGLATLKRVLKPGFFEALSTTTAAVVDGLAREARVAGVPFSAASLGGMFGLFFRASPPSTFAEVMTSDKEAFNRFFHAMLRRGIYLAPSAFEAGFVSSAHGPAEVESTLAAAREAFVESRAA